jgi:Mor family transcriptional regulator
LSRVKYVKAQTVFPESLLSEIQKYVQGEMVYIPKSPSNYKQWGSNTGAKTMVARRNEHITRTFKAGASVAQLAELYCLSEDTIKKIVYGK